MAGPAGALASMTGSAGVGATGAGVAVAGSAAGVGVRGLGTAARVTTAPAGIAVTGPTTGGIGMRSPRITGMTATGIRIRMRGSRPIASMAGSAGVGVTGAGVAMAGSTAGTGVRGLGTAGMTATGIRMRCRRVRIRM